jgi:hypothetical protein
MADDHDANVGDIGKFIVAALTEAQGPMPISRITAVLCRSGVWVTRRDVRCWLDAHTPDMVAKNASSRYWSLQQQETDRVETPNDEFLEELRSALYGVRKTDWRPEQG